jgi:2-amino-4-hydroxy-6-hydroxymethyldihydropteridine diphosphokinase
MPYNRKRVINKKIMPTAYIGIGSNLGDREENCAKALALLGQKGIKIMKPSSMIETEPWGVREQPKFMNMAIEVITDLLPYQLLRKLKEVEAELGRTETARWGPRIIDLDILFYNNTVMSSPELEIPHPHMHEREFVLMPLCEIAPDKIHPVLKKSVQEMLSELYLSDQKH